MALAVPALCQNTERRNHGSKSKNGKYESEKSEISTDL